MSTTSTDDLGSRLDAVAKEAEAKIKTYQHEAEAKRQEVERRFQEFLPVAERIADIAREKLERLRERLQFDVIPSQVRADRLYSRSVTLDVRTELASVVRLGFRLSHDSDVKNIFLDYNLEIIPVFFRFTPHARMEMALDSFDEAAVGKWLDDRIVEFAHDYLTLHTTEQYQQRVMVTDTVAGISFPKFYAAATLEHDGKTYYFISEETRREFAKQHGLTP